MMIFVNSRHISRTSSSTPGRDWVLGFGHAEVVTDQRRATGMIVGWTILIEENVLIRR
jgi:hypothetical protein